VQKHIVIIEHDRDILDIMRYLLEAEGYVVTGYAGFPSMAELVLMRPDCFIIEEWLPQVSGHAICLMLKARVQTSPIPVVLVSVSSLFEPMANLCEADAILGKPLIAGELVRVVSSVISRTRAFMS
jgi:DNA-binding response OmpR family regulator